MPLSSQVKSLQVKSKCGRRGHACLFSGTVNYWLETGMQQLRRANGIVIDCPGRHVCRETETETEREHFLSSTQYLALTGSFCTVTSVARSLARSGLIWRMTPGHARGCVIEVISLFCIGCMSLAPLLGAFFIVWTHNE